MSNDNLRASGQTTTHGYSDVSPVDVAAARDTVQIVDVRSPGEYTGELGHIPGALLVPLADLPSAASAWGRDTPIVLVCRSGARSAAAAAQLVTAGFRQVMNMRGGMMAYNARGLPVER